MLKVTTGEFSYDLDFNEASDARAKFSNTYGYIIDRGLKAGIKDIGGPYHKEISQAIKRSCDYNDALGEATRVLNDELQAVIYHLLSDLVHDAFVIGTSQALAGIDPAVQDRLSSKMLRARAAKTTPEREHAIEEAIRMKGPKVISIQKELRRRGFEVSDDAIRARKKSRVNSVADLK